ncbi:hypothetical protein ABZ621_17955 [Streptomyces sp. NPDC007863]|uniref:hypothetical protein n=1 Tax=Streptomyces sp. NPDC007863 TaxID=3154894 RepID=UPI0033D17455
MTYPGRPRPAPLFTPDPPPPTVAASPAVATEGGDAGDLFSAITRVGGRWTGRAVVGYALLALAASAAPDALAEPIVGHLSLALVLICPQVLLIGWALMGQMRESERLDLWHDRRLS